SFVACGVTDKDIIQNAYGYGLFTGGLGAHYGAEKLGAAVIPISGGNTKKQIMIMVDFKSTVLTATPSYAQLLADTIEEMGLLDKINLRVGVFGAEPWSENMRQKLEEKLRINAMDIYGLSEIMGPGVAIECEAKEGLHIWEDAFIPEIIDPQTLEPLEDGQEGELVITTIKKQAMPLIRYRTKDITRIIKEPCKCGRTHRRIQKILGRSDDMLIIRGVNVFPSQIESVLMEIEGLAPHYQLIVDRVNNLDTLEVQVEVDSKVFSDEIKRLQSLQNQIQKDIKDLLGITTKVTLVEPRTIQRSEGKAKRVIDKRKI
ncbi:MAG: phenylacetate--CoA ligase family protein, partial [Desulfurella sp.]